MDLKELQERQNWPLQQKIDHALFTIETFIGRMGADHVYVAFSGGKDSSVLLDLVRMIDPTIPAVFVNTGNEWPDIIHFVRHLRDDKGYNIQEIHPKMTPRQVWAKYGFPLVSKGCSQGIYEICHARDKEKSIAKMREVRNLGGSFCNVAQRWEYLIYEPYGVTHRCCEVLKKKPTHDYAKKTGRFPILGTMASESRQRTASYIQRGGCNTFGERGEMVSSLPLSIWTDDDIWEYIKMRNLEISEIYYKGQKRTGCVGCGFGCHISDDQRFDNLYMLYPKYYEMVMNYKNNGVTFREALRKLFQVVGKELPDESGKIFFQY